MRQIVNLGHAVRAKSQIKVRQPLNEVGVALPGGADSNMIEAQKEVILEELNVKNLRLISEASDIVEQSVTPNAKMLGPKYGKDVQHIIQTIKKGEFEIIEEGRVKVGPFILEKDEVEIGFKGKEGYDAQGEGGIVVILDTQITDELKKEGYARDIVRYIQDLRKDADYQVDDRITVWIEAPGQVDEAITEFADYIKTETLADEIQQSGDMDWDKEKVVKINGEEVKVGVRKVI